MIFKPGLLSRLMRRTVVWLVSMFSLAGAVRAAEPVDYVRQIKPLLARRCYACHAALKQQGGLRLDTVAALRAGGQSGAAIEAGDSAASLLIDAATGANGVTRMP